MTEEDIKKILDCRKAIDNHQEDRKNFRPNTDDHKNSVERYMKVLNDNGFKNVDEFLIANEEANYQLWKLANPIDGICDGCPHLKEHACVTFLKEKYPNCRVTPARIVGEPCPDASYRHVYKGRTNPVTMTVQDVQRSVINGKLRIFCPEGHGFYVDESKRTPYKKWEL